MCKKSFVLIVNILLERCSHERKKLKEDISLSSLPNPTWELNCMTPSSPSPAEFIDSQPVKVRTLSRAALTHRLKKTKSKMIKCRQCDNYIVVSGVECEEV